MPSKADGRKEGNREASPLTILVVVHGGVSYSIFKLDMFVVALLYLLSSVSSF